MVQAYRASAKPWGDATKAVFILTSLGKVLEAASTLQRLNALEGLVYEQT